MFVRKNILKIFKKKIIAIILIIFYTGNMKNIPPFNSQMGAILQLLSGNDPMAAFMKIAEQDPSLKPVLNMLNQGMSPQAVFNSLCQQKGIDPNTFISQFKAQ